MRFKLLLTEQPRTTRPLLLYARKDGHYNRPIRGAMADIRMEDMGNLQAESRARKLINYILPLPPIGEQTGKFGVINFGFLDKFVNEEEAKILLSSNKYLQFPYCPQCEFWNSTKRPWWEFAEVMDEYDGIIKAPFMSRPGELTPEEVDERLDEFEENRGKLEVLAPTTLERMMAGALKESYLKKLNRI